MQIVRAVSPTPKFSTMGAYLQERVTRIGLPTRGAFLPPIVEPARDPNGQLVDARLRYTLDLAEAMLDYSRKSLGYLPAK